MKTLKIFIVGIVLLLAGSTQAQVSVRLNVGTPPQWGPAGYDHARYYYLPDIECYYDVNNSSYIYLTGNRWIHSRSLPYRYRNYDLYGGYKVVMNDYRGNRPYDHFREYRSRYGRGYRGHEQRNIGVRHGDRGRGHEMNQSFRRDNRHEVRGPERRYNHNDRGIHQVQARGNDRGQFHGNDRGPGRGNDKGQGRGNDRGNKGGQDRGRGNNERHN